MARVDLKGLIRALAQAQGFELCGFAPADPVVRADYYRRWLSAGRAGGMDYLHRHVAERLDAAQLLPGARTVIVCALSYAQPAQPAPDAAPRGRVALYAWGEDYHRVLKDKLFAIANDLRAQAGEPCETKVCVDTAPLLEREYAMRAGLGWIGKNTLVLNRQLGSYFFLGEIVTTLDIAPDPPAVDHCGTCRRCLDACPTQAFPAPYEMDASRCISYLTIECRDAELPADLAPQVGDWVFGCDVCQQVCPYNRDVPSTREPRFASRIPASGPRLSDLLAWSDDDYRAALRGSAMKRAKPAMLRRNARAALRNAQPSEPADDQQPS